MIASAIASATLHREDVLGGCYDEDRRFIASGVGTIGARILLCEHAAATALREPRADVEDGLGELFGVALWCTEHVKGQALRRTLADPGELGELLDQAS